jgi:WD40 repeat protein
VYTFDAATRTARQPLLGHLLEAREVAFSPDGSLLVTRAWDATTRFWDPHGGTELLRVRGVTFLQFSRDGRRLAFRGYNSRELGIWELPRPEVRLLPGAEAADSRLIRPPASLRTDGQGLAGPRSVATQPHAGASFAPGGRLLATASGDGICLWDAPAGQLLARLESSPAKDVLIDPRGRWLLTAGDGGVRQYSLAREPGDDGEHWQVGAPRVLRPAALGQAFQLHCDGDGDRCLVVDRGFHVVLFRPAAPGERPISLRDHANVSYAAISPDGKYVATGTWRGTGVCIWEAATGRLVTRLPAPESAGVGFTPDGTRLLVLESEGAYRSYRVPDWSQDADRHDPDTGFTRGLRAAFHPDGRVMAHTYDRVNLRLVDLNTGDELAILPVPDSQNLAAYQFSPDGRRLAAITVRGVVQLWDLHSLRARLHGMGLDWAPAEPLSATDGTAGRQVHVTVRLGDRP